MQAGTGAVAESYIFNHRQKESVSFLGLDSFGTSKFTSSDALPPAKPHLLILLIFSNSVTSLVTKHSSIGAYEDHSYSNYYSQ